MEDFIFIVISMDLNYGEHQTYKFINVIILMWIYGRFRSEPTRRKRPYIPQSQNDKFKNFCQKSGTSKIKQKPQLKESNPQLYDSAGGQNQDTFTYSNKFELRTSSKKSVKQIGSAMKVHIGQTVISMFLLINKIALKGQLQKLLFQKNCKKIPSQKLLKSNSNGRAKTLQCLKKVKQDGEKLWIINYLILIFNVTTLRQKITKHFESYYTMETGQQSYNQRLHSITSQQNPIFVHFQCSNSKEDPTFTQQYALKSEILLQSFTKL
ncbi:MAG: hypothetical protein EZS28_023650 [Streblomastix strix]|uniref:Uncharacterized protein n=1 Tax=Streblomastix strix TaxID=222440 RepID=A0A5J4VEK1_9EUKA|nr:MAG: hypothetical protein EZS28_023650 [Streblomastix strix]